MKNDNVVAVTDRIRELESKLVWAEKRAKTAEAFHDAAVRERDAAWREIATLKAVNVWLTEALKPVLDVKPHRDERTGECWRGGECVHAVLQAKDIYESKDLTKMEDGDGK